MMDHERTLSHDHQAADAMPPRARRAPPSAFPTALHAFARFEELLRNPTYLFLRTHGFEGEHAGDPRLSPFQNMLVATMELVAAVLRPERIAALGPQLDHDVILAPVHGFAAVAQERDTWSFTMSGSSTNFMTSFAALKLRAALGLEVDFGFTHHNEVARNASSNLHRLAFPTAFTGPVRAGCRYVAFDDHVYSGSTVANLVGHLAAGGASVPLVLTLACNPIVERLALRATTLAAVRGNPSLAAAEAGWRARFGHGYERLTEVEASLLLKEAEARTESIVGAIAEYRRNPSPPTYPRTHRWPRLVEGSCTCSLAPLGLAGDVRVTTEGRA